MTILPHIPADHGVSLLYICKAADVFPIECREQLDALEQAGQVERYPDGTTMLWRQVATPSVADATPDVAHPRPSAADIIARCEQEANLPAGAICGRRRIKHVVRARDTAAARLRALRQMSYPEIAQALNLNSHASAIEAVKRHNSMEAV